MSSTDRRVVEMVFDNQAFEKGVAKTLNTLKQLDEALNLTGIVKGFTLDPIVKSINAVAGKFSVLEVAAMRAVQRITDKVINAGEQIVKGVTIDPISSGWSKYEQKTTGVQTIIAATGKSIEVVNEQLEKLNWFTDETSYNFTDMITNIGKFTSAGVELETAVTAMEGISTWASLSGQGVNEAGRAMYNLAQAMSTGTVKLMDWRSIENANMATLEFKNTVLEAAVAEGQLKKTADGVYATMKGTEVTAAKFNETLSEGWFTSNVLLDTLNQYGGAADKISEYSDASGLTTTRLLQALTDFQNEAISTNEVLEKYGDEVEGISNDQFIEYLQELSKEEYTLGIKAFKAAQEAKTFTEAIDATKDAVSTGWMTTFEHLFGNYEEAKVLWTNLANEMYDVFAESGNRRNKILKEWKSAEIGGRDDLISAISTSWSAIRTTFGEIRQTFDDIFGSTTVKNLTDFVTKFKSFSEKITPTEERLEKLNNGFTGLFAVLRSIGSSLGVVLSGFKELFGFVGPSIDYILDGMGIMAETIPLYNLTKAIEKFAPTVDTAVETVRRFGIAIKTGFNEVYRGESVFTNIWNHLTRIINVIHDLTDAIAGEAQNEVSSFHSLFVGLGTAFNVFLELVTRAIEVIGGFASQLAGPVVKGLGSAISFVGELLTSLNNKGLYDTWDRFLNFIVGIAGAVQSAFDKVFGGKIQNAITYFIDKFKEFIGNFKLSENTIPNIQKIFEGFFTIVKWGFDIIKSVIDFLAPIGKYISPLIDKVLELGGAIGSALSDSGGKVSDFLSNLSETLGPGFISLFTNLSDAINEFLPTGEELKEWFSSFGEKATALKDGIQTSIQPIVDALANLRDKIFEFLGIDANASFGQNVINVLTEFRDKIHNVIEDVKSAKSVLFGEVEKDPGELPGFVKFLVFIGESLNNLWEFIKNIVGKIIGFLGENKEEIFKGGFFVYVLQSLKQITGNFKREKEGLGDVVKTISELPNQLVEAFNKIKGGDKKEAGVFESIKSLAVSLLLLSVSVAILASLDPEKIGTGLLAVAVGLQILGKAYKKMFSSDSPDGDKKGGLLGLAVSLILMALAMKILGSMDTDKMYNGIIGLVGVMGAIALFLKLTNETSMGIGTGIALLGLANAILVIVAAIAIISLIRPDKAQLALMVLGEILAGFMLFALVVDNVKASSMIAAGLSVMFISAALLVLSGVVAIFTLFEPAKLLTAILGIAGVLSAITIAATVLASQKPASILLAAVAVAIVANALLLLTVPLAVIAKMDPAQFEQSMMGFLIVIGSVTMALIALSMMTNTGDAAGSAGAILIVSFAMLILAGAIKTLSKIKTSSMIKAIIGLAAVLVLLFFAVAAFDPMADSLKSFSVGLLIFSAALLVLGVALVAVSAGLTALGPSVLIFCALILKAVAYAVPYICEIIIDAILYLLTEVTKHGTEFVGAIGGLLIQLLYLIRDLIPPIVDIVVLLILSILKAIDELTGPVIKFLVSVLAKILLGLADGMAPLLAATMILIVKFIHALGVAIANSASPVATALENLIKGIIVLVIELLGKLLDGIPGVDGKLHDFAQSIIDDMEEPDFSSLENMMKEGTSDAIVDGINSADDGSAEKALGDMLGDLTGSIDVKPDSISGNDMGFLSDGGESITNASQQNLDLMEGFNLDYFNAGEENGTNATDGLTSGLLDGIPGVSDAGLDLSSALTDSITSPEGLDINSPSKKMRIIGRYAADGFVQGIQDSAKAVKDASDNVSDEAVAGMSNAIADISDAMSDDPNITPVITPVVDMSQADKALYGHFNNLNTPINATVNGNISRQFSEYAAQTEATKAQTASIIAELRRLRDDFGVMTQSISNIQMVLDTGALVGSMVVPMDAALGRRAQFKGRRN